MIFISYSNKNRTVAAEVKKELEAAHYECFMAHDDISAGADWHESIWTQLRTCDAFVGLVTSEFNASAFCQQEVGAALAMNKARLLVRMDVSAPPGFSGRFQAAKRKTMLTTLGTLDEFRQLRVNAWIRAVATTAGFIDSNSIHDRFASEWGKMPDDERLRWLIAAACNSQVRGDLDRHAKRLLHEPVKSSIEPRKSAPFFRKVFEELKPHLTPQWLFENDKEGNLHNPENNPVAKPKPASKPGKRSK
jgi:hypothetical protein